MMAQTKATKAYFTYRDYARWPEGERWELINGAAWNMGPAPLREHHRVTVELVLQIGEYLRGKSCAVYTAPFDVRLPKNDEDDDLIATVVQPDIAVICDEHKLDEKGCRGAPDWIIEITSPASAARDQIEKRELYERHGVREYWIVHPQDHLLTIYRAEGDTYAKPDIRETKARTPVGVLADFSIDWELIFPSERVGG